MIFDQFFRPRIFIDAAEPADAARLAEIHATGFARGWSEDEIEALIADRTVFALAFKRESRFGTRRILGFVLVRLAAGEAEILTIVFEPAARGRGHGRQLLEEVLRRLYSERAEAAFLEVDEGNAAAGTLYRRVGFVEVGRRKGYYHHADAAPSAALVMRLQVR